jgi:hypothetical protein
MLLIWNIYTTPFFSINRMFRYIFVGTYLHLVVDTKSANTRDYGVLLKCATFNKPPTSDGSGFWLSAYIINGWQLK